MSDQQNPEAQSENPAGEETQAAAENEDYAGYGSLEEMKKAIYESRKEGKRLAELTAMQQAQLQQLAKFLPQPSAERRAIDEINDLGLPAETFRKAVREELREGLGEEMAPMQQTQAAVNTLRATHPSFSKNEADFNKWLLANPEVADEYNRDIMKAPTAAKRLLMGVYGEYEASRRPANPEPKKVPAGAKVPGPSNPGSGARRTPSTPEGMSREDFEAAVRHARSTGDVVSLIKALKGDKPIHRDFAQPKG